MTGLSGRVGRSIAWSAAGSAIMRVGQLLVGIVAARLLAPEQFGVFAVTLVVYSIVVNVSEFGIASALVRSPREMDELAPTAVTVSLISAALLAGAMALSAPFVAHGFGIAAAEGPIVVMAIVVLLAGPSAVPAAQLTRHFRQDKRLLADVVNFVAANGLLVVLAVGGSGAYALAWSRVAGQAVSVVVLIWVAGKRYRPGFRHSALRYLLRLGLPLVGANLVGYAASAVDVTVVGHLLGAERLGVYNLAANVAGWPMQMMLPVLASVGLPLVALFQHDRGELSEVVGALTAAIGLLFLPVTGLLAVLSHETVLTLYGDVWAAAGPVLAALAVAGGVRVFLALYFDVLVAANAAGLLLGIQIVWLAVLCPAVVVGAHVDGAVGAAWAVTGTVGLVVLPLTLLVCRVRVGLSFRSVGGSSAWLLVFAVLGVAVAWILSNVLAGASSPALRLVAGTVGMLLVYGLLARRRGVAVLARLRLLIDRQHPHEPHPEHDPGSALEPVGLPVGATP